MNDLITYRNAVLHALNFVRSNRFLASGLKHYPSDKELAKFFSITPQAFSNITNKNTSASGITFIKILSELNKDQIFQVIEHFILSLNDKD